MDKPKKTLEQLIRQHLQTGRMMQVATVKGDQPWCCTVYYIFDASLNLYWISLPERRHSQEIHGHTKAAAAIPIKHTPGKAVVGLSVEGEAILVTDMAETKAAARLYADRYQRNKQWYRDFIAGKTNHKLYRLKPRSFVLFDEEVNPKDPRQEWKLKTGGEDL